MDDDELGSAWLATRRGQDHGNATLTEEQVQEIRRLAVTKRHTYAEMAAMFGVGATTIGRIVRNEGWTHLDPVPGQDPTPGIVRRRDGTLVTGTPGLRPIGSPPRRREMRFIDLLREAVTDEEIIGIIRKAVEQAKDGDRWARQFLWSYGVGKPRLMAAETPQEAPVITLMKLWITQQSGTGGELHALAAELVGTLPVVEDP